MNHKPPPPASAPEEAILVHSSLTLERKTITLELRQNTRGQLLRILELRPNQNRRDMIILPASVETLDRLMERLQEVRDTLAALN